jgi:hypothetical protein
MPFVIGRIPAGGSAGADRLERTGVHRMSSDQWGSSPWGQGQAPQPGDVWRSRQPQQPQQQGDDKEAAAAGSVAPSQQADLWEQWQRHEGQEVGQAQQLQQLQQIQQLQQLQQLQESQQQAQAPQSPVTPQAPMAPQMPQMPQMLQQKPKYPGRHAYQGQQPSAAWEQQSQHSQQEVPYAPQAPQTQVQAPAPVEYGAHGAHGVQESVAYQPSAPQSSQSPQNVGAYAASQILSQLSAAPPTFEPQPASPPPAGLPTFSPPAFSPPPAGPPAYSPSPASRPPASPPPTSPQPAGHRPTNGTAVTGAMTSFVPLLGLILSIIGLSKAKALGVGRTAAQVGIVLSLLFTAAWGAAGYYAYRVANSTAADPGCKSAAADYLRYNPQMEQDASAMTAGAVGTPAFTSAVKKYRADLTALIADFTADAAKAGHASVQTAIQDVSADLNQLDIGLGDLASGNYAGATHVMDLNTKLMNDFQHMESLCTSPGNG